MGNEGVEMKNNLKQIINKNPLIYSILQLWKYRKDDAYVELVRGLRDNPFIVTLQEGTNATDLNQPICVIQAGGKNDGFFACVRWALDGLYFCDKFGFAPVLKFSDDSLYYDPSMSKEKNPFEYYFEQPFGINVKEVGLSQTIIQYSSRNRLLAENLNGGVNYQVSAEYISQMAQIMQRYLHFNKEIMVNVNNVIKEREVGESVLGVHIRGTDFKGNFKNHPSYIEPELYFRYIDDAVGKFGFEKIYLATDDQDILTEFLEKYGEEKVLYAAGNLRGSGKQGIHTTKNNQRQRHQYMLGVEVINDMCSLAQCGGFISGLSQVSLSTRIYKKSQNREFIYDKTINKGVNIGGKSFSVK